MATCDYEEIRRKNLEDNKRILAELGLSNPFKLLPKVVKKGVKRHAADDTYQPKKKRAVSAPSTPDPEKYGSIHGSRRLSARLRGMTPGTECIIDEDDLPTDGDEVKRVQRVMPDRPNWHGEIPGVDVGTIWMTRLECCRDGVHRPTVAGIHGGEEGAYSIALSGGYEDDIDLGDCFTYTGEGGRDLKGTRTNPKNLRTAPQSKDQTLTRGNLALSKNVTTGKPVRVIRGYKLNSPFAPEEGYRYDGLYTVEKAWFTKGLSRFGVWKFALRRCKDQAPPPWELAQEAVSPSKTSDSGYSDSCSRDAELTSDVKSNAGGDVQDDISDLASLTDRKGLADLNEVADDDGEYFDAAEEVDDIQDCSAPITGEKPSDLDQKQVGSAPEEDGKEIADKFYDAEGADDKENVGCTNEQNGTGEEMEKADA
ncbi:hypothetical protein BaRGS_00039235 [Batillaria attramentaria]|uniref:YDG domain-containing protein n=1 Tax=Batillaria attramentaria TaxID=370345 RepID=A0ABD0J3M6_9CAEN